MRRSASTIVDGIAWVGIFALIAASLGVVLVLGFPGVLILGLLTALTCARAELSERTPTWGQAVFEARAARGRSPEERAAADEAVARATSPLRYYRACGLALIVAGLLGTAWQIWGTG
ncbi:hypothetical protein D9599_13695 [Roseomonas sp. KE2513]|uniref:hypothetical protein n=1 Tax=Roseomonas sp. KE2513 TaxID=2479202 RepID=UPI0018E015B8|nr:hypothetical protein [Roseomonas sp. KE2513]MBI0536631.1 hypothetical protein [Roseomonas sp. KE2513]